MTAVILALVASVSYGVSDFFGGVAARRRGTISATVAVYGAATVVGVSALAVLPWTANVASVTSGVIAGVLAIIGFLAFYAALAIGPMSVLSPVISLINTTVPVVAALVLGDRLGPLGWVGLVIALVAGALVSIESPTGAKVERRGLLLAIVAGLLLGGSIVALDAAPQESGILPAVLDAGVGFVILAPFALLMTRSQRGWLRTLNTPESPDRMRTGKFVATTAIGGALLGLSNILLILALQSGELAVVAVLISLYPVVTVILAAALLRERLTVLQMVGVACAFVAALLLSIS